MLRAATDVAALSVLDVSRSSAMDTSASFAFLTLLAFYESRRNWEIVSSRVAGRAMSPSALGGEHGATGLEDLPRVIFVGEDDIPDGHLTKPEILHNFIPIERLFAGYDEFVLFLPWVNADKPKRGAANKNPVIGCKLRVVW